MITIKKTLITDCLLKKMLLIIDSVAAMESNSIKSTLCVFPVLIRITLKFKLPKNSSIAPFVRMPDFVKACIKLDLYKLEAAFVQFR